MRLHLFLSKNICCGCSFEASHRDASKGYHSKCFHKKLPEPRLSFFGGRKCLISRVNGGDSFHTKSMVPRCIRARLRRLIVPDLEDVA